MARYLERLVARAGVPAEALASPAPRSQYEREPGDPFEETALWNPVAPPASPAPVAGPSQQDAGPAAPPVQPPGVTVVPAVEARDEESQPPGALRIQPPASTPDVVPNQIELHPQPDMFERPAQPAPVHSESVIERETVHEKVRVPIPPAESPALNLADVEKDVLAKLMPTLDAWLASGTPAAPAAPAAPAVPPSIVPQRPEPGRAVSIQTPQLVIGSISVEVVSAPAPAAVPARRLRTIQSPSPQPDAFPTRLGFGLGQT
jgi:hypothetical protein